MRFPVLTALMTAAALVAPSPGLAQSGPKIGVFDSKVVFEQTAEGQRLQKQLNDRRDDLRSQVEAKESEARDLQQKLREGEFTLSEERKNMLQKELQRKLVELDSLKQEANSTLRLELEDVQQQLDSKLMAVVQEIGAEQAFDLIFERNTQVVFANSTVDISPLVVERFNSKYPPAGGSEE
jgi:Skp family chaperone for outer membrane proteins